MTVQIKCISCGLTNEVSFKLIDGGLEQASGSCACGDGYCYTRQASPETVRAALGVSEFFGDEEE